MRTKTDFDDWIEAFAADWVRSNPQLATTNQYFSGAEQDALDRQLSLTGHFGVTYGKRAADRRAALARRGLQELRERSRTGLSPSRQVSADIVEWRLDDAIKNAPFAQNRFVFTQMIGLHVGLVSFLTAIHPIRNERDAENYLARLGLVATCLDEGIDEARSAADAGFVPPRFILERTIEQLDGLAGGEPSQHTLVTSLAARLAQLPLPAERAQRVIDDAAAVVERSVVPAFVRVRDMLAQQVARSSDDAGAWSLPDGKAYYARQLASFTGSSLSPQAIHEMGLREVARIEARMDAILSELGFAQGTIKERTLQLNVSLGAPSGSDARAAILEQLQTILSDARRRSRRAFNIVPQAPVTVMREPAFSERSAAAHYTAPAPDGTLPGVYWVPLAEVGPAVPWLGIGTKSTAYHEAIPGHHFQLAIEQEMEALPHFRKRRAFGFDSSYGEGWALYAEHFADENGWYEGDLPSRLGYLDMQLFRARRLVVDTGLHEFKWTRQQAIDFGLTAAEVERYITWPGQACSYMIGQMRLLEMRERAQATMNERFSIQGFHDLVLTGGTMPLDVLARRVEAWALGL